MKNILSILTIVLAVTILVFGGYYFRGKQESQTVSNQGVGLLPSAQDSENQNAGTQTQDAVMTSSKLNKISESPVLDYFVDAGSNVFAIQPDGKVLRISGGKTEILSSTPVAGLTSASFSYDGKRIMAFAGASSSGSKINIFDAVKKSWSLLPNIAQSPVWSPSGYQIAFLSPAGKASAVYLVDADNLRLKPVEILRISAEDLVISWPNASTMFLSDRPNSAWNSSLWSLNIPKKTLSSVISDRPGLETAWSFSSPAVGLAFSSGTNGQGGKLKLVSQEGKQLQEFKFLTFPSKCVFYNKPVAPVPAVSSSTASSSSKKASPQPQKYALTVVCAVPRDRQTLDNSRLPDAYLQKAVFTSDNFFEINISTGEIKSIFGDLDKNFDADDIKVFNGAVFFINRYDKKVYSIDLPK